MIKAAIHGCINKNEIMKFFILLFLILPLVSVANETLKSNVDLINIAEDVDKAKSKSDLDKTTANLEMEPEEEYINGIQQPIVKTTEVFHASGRGLLRGMANIATCPGELVRGFTYEYTSREWYVAAGTSFLAAFGGTSARLYAGAGDIITLGTFGNVELAKGFPDYVWQDAWFYIPPLAVPTKGTSIPAVAAEAPEKDISAGVSSRVIKERKQENIDFYKSQLPRDAY